MAGYRYSVAFYCPDTNIRIAGDLPGEKGLGGGKTAIIKAADALHRAGNEVRVYAYCSEGVYNGVEYIDSGRIDAAQCDVLIAITGHKCDLSDLSVRNVKAGLRILWLSGSGYIKGADDAFFDYYYANSVFLKERVVTEWRLPAGKVIAVQQGYDPHDFPAPGEGCVERNVSGIVFASHPFKGLDRTIRIVGRLREEVDESLSLDIYGGNNLWSDSDATAVSVEKSWIRHNGMVSQPELCGNLFRYGFMLHLTSYEDTSSILIQQAKKAGVIVIASGVGGNSELIKDGYDGFIVQEHCDSEECYRKVKRLVQYILNNGDYAAGIRENAMKHSLTWEKITGGWVRHWDAVFAGESRQRLVASKTGKLRQFLGKATGIDFLMRNRGNSPSPRGVAKKDGA